MSSFTPVRMRKVRIVVPKSSAAQAIHALYELDALHVTSYKNKQLSGLDAGAPL